MNNISINYRHFRQWILLGLCCLATRLRYLTALDLYFVKAEVVLVYIYILYILSYLLDLYFYIC